MPRIRWLGFPAALAHETLNSLVLFLWTPIPCHHTLSQPMHWGCLVIFLEHGVKQFILRSYKLSVTSYSAVLLLLLTATYSAGTLFARFFPGKFSVKYVNSPTCGMGTSLRRCCQESLPSFMGIYCSVQMSAGGKGALSVEQWSLLKKGTQ